MSLFRIILIALAGFFAIRLIRSLVRTFAHKNAGTTGGATVSGKKPSKPLEKPFRDATDASFEDISGTADQKARSDRPS